LVLKGDKVPSTWWGKMVASCFCVFGIAFFALPALNNKFTNNWIIYLIRFDFLIKGHSWFGFRFKSPTKATSKAFQSANTSCSRPYPSKYEPIEHFVRVNYKYRGLK
jgi:hypothetical protein